MKQTAIYTLTSELHDEQALSSISREILDNLNVGFELKGDNYADYGSHALDIIYVRTGGTEGIFKQLLPHLQEKSEQPFYLLTSGKSNSLAAAMEILSFLRQHNIKGEIIHGSSEYISRRVEMLAKVSEAKDWLKKCRVAVIGKPSDWLIASQVDYELVNRKLGLDIINLPMEELMDTINNTPRDYNARPDDAFPDANRIYMALKSLVEQYQLEGYTLRCFDLLNTVHNTGCWAMAKLNSEGYAAGCEGDIPALLTMMISRSLLGVSGFLANPATINPETGELLFAHCTIPLNMVERYELDTHYESGIGIGIRGFMKEGPVTIFKVSGNLERYFVAEGTLMMNLALPNLCRTQQVIQLKHRSQACYFLNDPIGNHHIVLPGHQRALLEEMMKNYNSELTQH